MNNYDYPMGADNEDAPWNEKENDEREFDVVANYELSRTAVVRTSSYKEEFGEYDEEGFYIPAIVVDEEDLRESFEQDNYDPVELITVFLNLLKEDKIQVSQSRKEYLIEQCTGYSLDDSSINEG